MTSVRRSFWCTILVILACVEPNLVPHTLVILVILACVEPILVPHTLVMRAE